MLSLSWLGLSVMLPIAHGLLSLRHLYSHTTVRWGILLTGICLRHYLEVSGVVVAVIVLVLLQLVVVLASHLRFVEESG